MSAQITITNWPLDIDVDMVLRGQGADPAVVRQRRPRLIKFAEQARLEGLGLIEPVVVYRILPVEKLRHNSLVFTDGTKWTSAALGVHLAQAQQVSVIVCTLGPALEERISILMRDDPSFAYALDGFGSAALSALSTEICSKIDAEAHEVKLYTSIPLSPGMIGWPVDVGQQQIFTVLDTEQVGITLNESAQIIPHKSVSMILGISQTPFVAGRTCDFCNMRETCHYQNLDFSLKV